MQIKRVGLVIAAIGAICLLSGWLLRGFVPGAWDFRNNLWAPAHLLWQGRSPYAIGVLFENSGALWFPQTIGLFSALGLLPLEMATASWLVFNVLLLTGLCLIFLWQSSPARPHPPVVGFCLLAAFLFPPSIRVLVLG